ncbi:hypothetical protein FB2170_01921 [Maribacter sp. HTCC2170]|nr:hypothetical protein FB2170_01921 [Maribacter sp. HTCC2170]
MLGFLGWGFLGFSLQDETKKTVISSMEITNIFFLYILKEPPRLEDLVPIRFDI